MPNRTATTKYIRPAVRSCPSRKTGFIWAIFLHVRRPLRRPKSTTPRAMVATTALTIATQVEPRDNHSAFSGYEY